MRGGLAAEVAGGRYSRPPSAPPDRQSRLKIPRVHVQHGRYYYVQDLEARRASGRPQQKWHPLTRVDAGEPALLQVLAELLGEQARREGNFTQLLEVFKKEHLPRLSVTARKEYTRMYDVAAAAFHEFDVDQVAPGDVLGFLGNFNAHPTTRRAYKARLSTFFSWCVLNSHLQANPCREIKLKAPARRKGKMNDALYWAIYDALSPMGRCFLELAYFTRQRPTEIRLLRESAIGEDRIHFVPSKTEDSSGEEVDVLITPEIRAALERARSLRQKPKVEQLARRRDPFIIQTRDGDGYTKTGLYEVWRDGIAAAGLQGRNITTRDIRPFALAKMEQLGYPVEKIRQAAAHTTTAQTDQYLNQHRDRLSDARLPLPERKP